MLFFFRCIAMVTVGAVICFLGSIYCLVNPRNPKNVARFAHILGFFLIPFLGVKVVARIYPTIQSFGSCVFIANHQNNYDVLIASKIVQPKTVTLGKKNLIWVPFFGMLYYLSGNILLDRNNKLKARRTIEKVVGEIKKKSVSVWIFPEGTRNRGKVLLPFKIGAFWTAIKAGVPVVPICISNTNDIHLNRCDNGSVIVEMLKPIETKGMSTNEAKQLMDRCYHLMSVKINQLNQEVASIGQND